MRVSPPVSGLNPSSPLKTRSHMVEDGAGDFEKIPNNLCKVSKMVDKTLL